MRVFAVVDGIHLWVSVPFNMFYPVNRRAVKHGPCWCWMFAGLAHVLRLARSLHTCACDARAASDMQLAVAAQTPGGATSLYHGYPPRTP